MLLFIFASKIMHRVMGEFLQYTTKYKPRNWLQASGKTPGLSLDPDFFYVPLSLLFRIRVKFFGGSPRILQLLKGLLKLVYKSYGMLSVVYVIVMVSKLSGVYSIWWVCQ